MTEQQPSIRYQGWCGVEVDDKAPRKPGSQLSMWGDALHDKCLRQAGQPSESQTWFQVERTEAWHLVIAEVFPPEAAS